MVRSSIFFLSLFTLTVSCTEREWYKKEIDNQEYEKLATQLMFGGNYYQGSVPEQFLLDEALAYDTNNAALWRELGTARVKRGIADEMEYYYGKAVEKDAMRWVGFRGYLYLYFYRDFEKAIADFDYSDQLMGEVGFSQGQNHDYMRGISYYGLERYDEAINSLSSYIDFTSKIEGEEWVDVMAFLYRGMSYQAIGDLEMAYDSFEKVLKYYSNSSDAQFHQAEILFEKGQFSASLNKLKDARDNFNKGYYHLRPYVEVLGQLYVQDLDNLEKMIFKASSKSSE